MTLHTFTVHTSQPWYVIYCNPHKEWQTAQTLRAYLGLHVYLPELHRKVRHEIRVEPLFPRYMFIQADLEQTTPSHLNAVPGVTHLVTVEQVPQALAHDIVAELRQHVDEMNAQQRLRRCPFTAGDAVRFTEGPLQGLEAVFVESLAPSERARVLIEFLGEQRTAFVDIDMLERAHRAEATHATAAPQPKRYSRGRGRKVNNSKLANDG
jgi:transcriptional antiterminator RfaH